MNEHDMPSTQPPPEQPPRDVYTTTTTADGREVRVRIGTLLKNYDGSFTIKLEALPVSGELHVECAFVSARCSKTTMGVSPSSSKRCR